jgi:hypothetical protein
MSDGPRSKHPRIWRFRCLQGGIDAPHQRVYSVGAHVLDVEQASKCWFVRLRHLHFGRWITVRLDALGALFAASLAAVSVRVVG